MALPGAVKEQGFEAITNKMARLLACDSTAGRMRALTELKHLGLRPNQEVAEFCVVLEKLGRQAHPEGSFEDRSLEYAQILLDNLSGWPEHFQLVSALHKVEPKKAYEEVKQLALSIEQSKLMLSKYRKKVQPPWKARLAQYQEGRDGRNAIRVASRGPGSEERNSQREPSYRAPAGGPRKSGGVQEPSSRPLAESKRCYNCSRYGHIGRECPQRATRVNQIGKNEQQEGRGKATLSSIADQARSHAGKMTEK
ncbi:zinc knuckle [Ostertagia ostertagi]